ncbi:MAG TPA: hypothetical protein P5277_03735 [Candidatus Paceibacterota bacterium]|nr:hypothetical protein [Candidatus Paceibacterota bacterium]
MVKNNLGVLQTKQLAVLFGAVLIVGLVAGVIGSSVGNALTGKVTLSNNAAGTGTYRIRPEGTNADTWLPYSDGNVYLTSNGAKSGAGFVLRKWLSGSTFQNLMTIDKNGNMVVNGNLNADNVYSKSEVNMFVNKVLKYDILKIESASTRLTPGRRLTDVRTTFLSRIDLKNSLARGVFTTNKSQDYMYDQEIKIGPLEFNQFTDHDYQNNKSTLGIKILPNTNLMNYTLRFAILAQSSVDASGNLVDFIGKNIKLFGKNYKISEFKKSPASLTLIDEQSNVLKIDNNGIVKLNEGLINELVGYVYLTQESTGVKWDKLELRWQAEDKKFLVPGKELTMPGFETVKYSMQDNTYDSDGTYGNVYVVGMYK